MIRSAILLMLAPLAAQAQLQLSVVTDSRTAAVASGATFSLGQIPSGGSEDFVIQARNTGSATLGIAPNTPALSGAGFTITSPTPAAIPPNIAPGGVLNIYIHFSASAPAAYSASFQLNSTSILLIATVVPAATVTAASPCTGPDSSLTIGFGNVGVSRAVACSIQLLNQSSQTLTVSTISVGGVGFLLSQPPSTPLVLTPGASSTFPVTFAPSTATAYSGALTVDSATFQLSGTASNPALPTPILNFDNPAPHSGQQITLTMSLPTASPIAASGSVNLAFQPDPGVAATAGADPAINFVLTNAKSIPFTIQPGATQATLGGQPNVIFATGTTAGKLTFTVSTSAQLIGDPTTSIVLAPIPTYVENAAATALAGQLNVQVWGFDNTYSAGPMSFTFFDNLGHAIGAGPVTADFSSSFRSYFSASADGGAFAMLVTFPVTGNAAEVGSVNVQMTNAAGVATISNLVFLNDTGTCVLIGNALSCPGSPTQ